jgi:hypothetical protein
VNATTKEIMSEVACPEVGCWARVGQHCETHGKCHKTRIQLAKDVRVLREAADVWSADKKVAHILTTLADKMARALDLLARAPRP